LAGHLKKRFVFDDYVQRETAAFCYLHDEMKYFRLTLMLMFVASLSFTAAAQQPKLSEKFIAALDRAKNNETDLARRTAALAGLLKAQRQLWSAARQSTLVENTELRNAAKATLIRTLENDPTLAEAYTMLAELELTSQSQNVSEALAFTQLATRSNPANFGGHVIQARIYTRTSGITGQTFDRDLGSKAIAAWKEVVKLDPLNAEAWAFLGHIYQVTGEPDQQIEALRNWTGSPVSSDAGFYRAVMGRDAELTPEAASFELAAALLKRKRTEEAVDILTRLLIDDPENTRAARLAAETIDSEPKATLDKIAGKLRSALSENPGNAALILLVEKL
jgi:tetratricopeptide (TPR) repeat protein